LPPSRGAARAFTLIELLVVTAVIAILAAILFPVFAAARDKARQAGCMSNLRQVGMAGAMYVQDNDESFPPGPYDGLSTLTGIPFHQANGSWSLR
jgi:prepilin-type N-terminal cleavage/methylation domain-containing protein